MMGFNGYGGFGPSPWMWLAGGLMMVLFWGVVAALVIWVVKVVRSRGVSQSGHALELLQTRLATGEITVDEYEKRRQLLQG